MHLSLYLFWAKKAGRNRLYIYLYLSVSICIHMLYLPYMEDSKPPKAKIDSLILEGLEKLLATGKVKSERQFCLLLGINPTVVYKVKAGIQSFPQGTAFKMQKAWPDSLPDHLVVADFEKNEKSIQPIYSDKLPGRMEGIAWLPMARVNATATFASTLSEPTILQNLDKIPVAGLPPMVIKKNPTLLVIELAGESMVPTLLPGDRLVLSLVPKQTWGELKPDIYVFSFQDQVVAKRMINNTFTTAKEIILYSDNAAHGQLTVAIEDIFSVFKIHQLMRNYNN